jgi:hypothetical protein
MKMFIVNVTGKPFRFRNFKEGIDVTLLGGNGFRIDGGKIEIDYYRAYRPAGLKIMSDSDYFLMKGIRIPEPVAPVVEEEVEVVEEVKAVEEVEVVEEVKAEVVVDDAGLSGDAYYNHDFLTKKKAITILQNRGIEFNEDALAEELKQEVIKTNPIV